jgi:hypothetical protein
LKIKKGTKKKKKKKKKRLVASNQSPFGHMPWLFTTGTPR